MNDNAIRVLGDTPQVAGASLRQGAFALLRHAAAGERDAALAELDQLFALRGRFHAYPLLLDMVAGKQPWHASGSLFVLDAAPLPPALQAHFEEAIACCAAFLELPAPCILLQCRAESRDLHLTMESFPGLALLRLSTLSPGYPDDLRAVQFHEVAHCFLTCGVRLLDEGLAHFFASRHAGATLPAANMELLPPMRALLSRSADSMFGESVDSDLAVYKSACRVGADLLEAIYALGGAARVTRLFAAVARAGSEAQIVRLVEEASGQSFPAFARSGGPSAAQAALIERARQAVFTAWINKNPADIDEAIATLEADDVYAEPALLDSLLGARINRALLQVNFATPPAADELARLELLLKAAECLPQGRLWLWRGTHAILMILLARPNIIKVASAGQQAIQAFNKAVQLIPDDPDLLVQHASLLLHAPPAYGGDRDLGVSKLRQAMLDPVYREHARQVLLEYGIETPAEESTAAAAEQIAPPASEVSAQAFDAAPAPVLLELSGVELRLSSSFTLRPGALTVRRGERVAFIGRNGSGKSMLMETLLGLRRPDRGTVALHLGDPREAATRQRIGGLLQGYDLPGQTKVREMMALHQAMYHRTDAAVTRALGLDELRDRYWQQLSRGQKQRLMLWMALAHVPELAILDEPSLGLDEWFARALRELLATLPVTLLVISHAPSDLLGMDRICCIDDGRIVAEGTLASLMTQRVGQFKGALRQALPESALEALRALPALVQPPHERVGAWELFGGAGFDQAFRQFIEQHRIGTFSLEPVSVEDFLADVTQIAPTKGQST
ncbi:ATP-binding cassette domain-containing protein [Duganella sp. HH105]|uniref:ATP-binding cassette domain-containing protein n=1 Tax=Duganella sp. HH105 TaxID=1781067 RepID=UPI000877BF36|nr:ABC transporter ATP-binding protein [Duganella sp. HH105]OEZ60361.1 sulfate/thiosulfate import ATP-binding protein CysA [Duganella sp. HH105]